MSDEEADDYIGTRRGRKMFRKAARRSVAARRISARNRKQMITLRASLNRARRAHYMARRIFAPTRKQMITLRASLNRARRAHDMARREGKRLKLSIVVRNRRIRELEMKLRRSAKRKARR